MGCYTLSPPDLVSASHIRLARKFRCRPRQHVSPRHGQSLYFILFFFDILNLRSPLLFLAESTTAY